MKKLLLLWLFSGSLDGFSQQLPDELPKSAYTLEVKEHPRNLEHAKKGRDLGTYSYIRNDRDTLRAWLLVSRGKMQAAYSYLGFIICEDDEKNVVGYLTDGLKPFKNMIVFGHVIVVSKKRFKSQY